MKSDEAKYIILYELECNKYTNKQTDFMSFIQNMNILITIFRIKKNSELVEPLSLLRLFEKFQFAFLHFKEDIHLDLVVIFLQLKQG